jgi:hypothetical protein
LRLWLFSSCSPEGDPLNAEQNLNVLWGKLLRIDVDTDDDTRYAVPKNNPFASLERSKRLSSKNSRKRGSTAIAVMPTRSPMARNSTHQTASSVTVLMVRARDSRQGRGL